MGKKRKPEEPGGGASWITTFSDLMNLLLCFFVLLFSMSSVDAEKFEEVVASLNASFSIFDGGSSSITDGNLISSGISQLNEFNDYYNNMGLSREEYENGKIESMEGFKEQFKDENIKDSETMGDNVEDMLENMGIEGVKLSVSEYYITLELNGEILFDPSKAELKKECLTVLGKIANILKKYEDHRIQILGHTDNVPMAGSSDKYIDNMELSMGRAYSVMKYFTKVKGLSADRMECTGRGELDPIAPNDTAEGRKQNRRVEIRIYNKYSSQIEE